MKKFKNSAIALLLMTCMLFTAGCGGKTEPNVDPTPTQGATNENPTGGGSTTNSGSETTNTDTPAKTDPTPAPTEGPKEIVTIKYGTHWVDGLDPHIVDEATGEFKMAEDQRQARLAAEKAILETYGVVFEYVQYPGDTRESLLQSVYAGDPICDIAILWGGSESTVLAQNVIQPIDEFAYIFQNDPDYAWMLDDAMFGHYYLLNDVIRYMPRWPLAYNITLLEAVDTLKDANGNTIYPNQLFEEGKWTWSVFKDYLEKVNAYYANDDSIRAYFSDHRFAALNAAYSAGAAIYDNGIGANSDRMKKAVAFIKELYDAGLLTENFYDDKAIPDPVWCQGPEALVYGTTVFTETNDWELGWASSEAATRGEAIGILPWPRPDDMAFDDENYKQVITIGDSHCILKGVSKERAELALKAWALYTKVYNCELAEVDTIAEVKSVFGAKKAAEYGLDIFNEKYGDLILSSFLYIGANLKQDPSDILGFRGTWDTLVNGAVPGLTASYDVQVEADMGKFDEVVQNMMAALSKEGVNDTAAPVVEKTDAYNAYGAAVVPVGTKMTDDIWMTFMTAVDGVEGELGMASFVPEFNTPETDKKVERAMSEADLLVPGCYNRMFKAYFKDSSDNKGYFTASVIVYDPNNKVAPTVTLGTEPVAYAKDTDANTIQWVTDGFVASAVDANGVDVSKNIKADLSNLDMSTPGTYEVELTVADFAGNETKVTVKVTVQ